MSKEYIECAKCHKNAETEPNRREYTKSYPIRSKDETIYCWYCYKSVSHCKVCDNSVANMKISAHDPMSFPRVSGFSRGCERVENEVEFTCSQKCLDKFSDEKYKEWKEKLSQGWTKCKECIDLVNWIVDISGNKESHKFAKEEKFQSRLINLVPSGEEKLCERHEQEEKIEKPHKEKIRIKAQKYWDTLSYETRLREVKRTRSVGWGNFYKSNLDAEGIAAQGEVPYGVVYEFELRDCHRDCSDCHLDKDFQNSTVNDNNLSTDEDDVNKSSKIIANNGNELSRKETELQWLLENKENKDWRRISKLRQEIKSLKSHQQNNSFPKEFWFIGISIFALLGVVIFLIKRKKHSSKSQATKYKIK